eukprot:SM000032S12157  [mRNA]  locus=s32:822289:823230:- [translate_table: standard]
MQALTVQQVAVQNGTDATGLVTSVVYANATVLVALRNPNSNYAVKWGPPVVSIVYSNLAIVSGSAPGLRQGKHRTDVVAALMSSSNLPLFGAGPALSAAIAADKVPLEARVVAPAHIEIIGSFIESDYTRRATCSFTLTPSTLYVSPLLC